MIDTQGLTTEELLTMWGRWASTGGNRSRPVSLGVKPCWEVWTRGQYTGGHGIVVDRDTDMMRIDNAMARLRHTNNLAFKVLKLRYLYGYSYNRLASKLSRDLPKYARNHKLMCHKTAKLYVDDALEEIENLLT